MADVDGLFRPGRCAAITTARAGALTWVARTAGAAPFAVTRCEQVFWVKRGLGNRDGVEWLLIC